MTNCKNCGAILGKGRYCQYCGADSGRTEHIEINLVPNDIIGKKFNLNFNIENYYLLNNVTTEKEIKKLMLENVLDEMADMLVVKKNFNPINDPFDDIVSYQAKIYFGNC